MTVRIRLMILMARPAVVLLLGLFTALGLAQAGQAENRVLLVKALLVVVGFLLFSVAVNDLADEAIDRVNRIADRGAVASLLLPAGYVAVPYLVGVLSARGSIAADDLALLGGLYVGFIGRIVLKDFRDVRGDALFGKRTFLVRHGRRRACALSAASWTAGAATLAAVRQPTLTLVAGWAVYLAVALWLLRALSVERGRRRDEALISAIAIVGRGMMVTLLAHLSMTGAHWSAPAYPGVIGALVAITLGQAWTMARRGPTTSLTVPADWVTTATKPGGHSEPTHGRMEAELILRGNRAHS